MTRRLSQLAMGLVFASAALGCGAAGVEVDGKLTNGAAAYSLAENETITVTLIGEAGQMGTAEVQKDGSFVVKDGTGKPLKPGKYKITIVHYVMPKTKAKDGSPPMPTTKETGETVDVSASNKSITIDMAKYK
ncbi:MAG: hypothetical protein FJ304_06885 [Planctomycetes bacterium]|nr:hypothetical protein [Planctomycetota bacterium]